MSSEFWLLRVRSGTSKKKYRVVLTKKNSQFRFKQKFPDFIPIKFSNLKLSNSKTVLIENCFHREFTNFLFLKIVLK